MSVNVGIGSSGSVQCKVSAGRSIVDQRVSMDAWSCVFEPSLPSRGRLARMASIG